jgi:hypothetical protein
MADLAANVGDMGEARRRLAAAVDTRRRLHRREPQRIDLAEELCVTLYQLAHVGVGTEDSRSEIVELLAPFEKIGAMTPKSIQLLQWARSPD